MYESQVRVEGIPFPNLLQTTFLFRYFVLIIRTLTVTYCWFNIQKLLKSVVQTKKDKSCTYGFDYPWSNIILKEWILKRSKVIKEVIQIFVIIKECYTNFCY